MSTTRPMPTENERDDWHRMELAELINELSDYLSALEWELSGHDCTDLANPINRALPRR